MTLLKLVRFPNLLIIALTQVLIYVQLFVPALHLQAVSPTLYVHHLILLVITTMLLAASGYIVNDIVDYPIDIINKPTKVFIGKAISIQHAWVWYFTFVVIGFLLALYLGIQTNNLPLLGIYPLAVLLLYWYSTFFKRMPFWGNLIVALFCAFVPGVVLLAEHAVLENQQALLLMQWYIVFAFLTTLLRELVKDIEDVEGDKIGNCRTIPIALGLRSSKFYAGALGLFLLLGYAVLLLKASISIIGQLVFLVTIVFPTIYISIKLVSAKEKKDFSRMSNMLKIVMIFGLFFLLTINL